MLTETKTISNWGLFPEIEATVRKPMNRLDLLRSVDLLPPSIARGLGRCYGDSSLSGSVVDMTGLNRFLSFDRQRGIISCEAGTSFDEILDLIVPHGWFLPVTPGTRFVTVGGAIASDVHGKNHHVAGTFSEHINSFEILLADGAVKTCSKTENSQLFEATCGGMGLTGIILSATFNLKRIQTSYINQKTIKARNLDEIMAAFDDYAAWPYSVAWIDCLSSGKNLGRSVLMVGENAPVEQLPDTLAANPLMKPNQKNVTVPIFLPGFLLNSVSVRAFNQLYYSKSPAGVSDSLISYQPFFYPLDVIHHWNRIYGRQGFTQYQFVLPPETSKTGLVEIIETISKKGTGSFLAVLKQFGAEKGMISFPKEGYTLALDFPIKPGIHEFLNELDQLVLKYGGRLYLTKDARMQREMMTEGYPRLNEWLNIIREVNPELKWSSLQFKRIFGGFLGN